MINSPKFKNLILDYLKMRDSIWVSRVEIRKYFKLTSDKSLKRNLAKLCQEGLVERNAEFKYRYKREGRYFKRKQAQGIPYYISSRLEGRPFVVYKEKYYK